MRLITVVLAVFLFHNSFAQLTVSEDKRNMSQGANSSFRVELPGIDEKTAEDNWKKFVKSYKGKLDYERKDKEWVLTGAEMPSLSTTTVTAYAKFEESGKGLDLVTTVTVWFDTGNGFISSSSNRTTARSAEEIVENYALVTAKNHAEDVLKEEEKELSDLEKDLKNLVKDKESYEKKIEDAEKLIAEMKEKIEDNEKEQEKTEDTIEEQKKAVKKAEANLEKF
jgi:vacuolar-type H+-ATPase subunit I/STV1